MVKNENLVVGIRKEDGLLHCFTCGETCTLQELIGRCFGRYDIGQFGQQWLRDNFLVDLSQNREIKLCDFDTRTKKDKPITFVTEEELDSYRYYHNYMYKRKLTNEIIEKFDIGFDSKTNCITFPVKDEKGNCLFIARRSVEGKQFYYPVGVEKPVYGLYELPKDADEVIVCESMLNALTCWVYGKYAVALNGTGTDYQIEQLKRLSVRKIILALDPDNAGMRGTQKLKSRLYNHKIVTELVIPSNKDINDLSFEQFENLLEIF